MIQLRKRDYKNDPKDTTDMDNVSTRDHGNGKEDDKKELEEAELDKKDKDMKDDDDKDDGDDKDDADSKVKDSDHDGDHDSDCNCDKCTSINPELVKDSNASARSVRL